MPALATQTMKSSGLIRGQRGTIEEPGWTLGDQIGGGASPANYKKSLSYARALESLNPLNRFLTDS